MMLSKVLSQVRSVLSKVLSPLERVAEDADPAGFFPGPTRFEVFHSPLTSVENQMLFRQLAGPPRKVIDPLQEAINPAPNLTVAMHRIAEDIARRECGEVNQGFLGLPLPVFIVTDPDMEPGEWRISNRPMMHLTAGPEIAERLKNLGEKVNHREAILEALTEPVPPRKPKPLEWKPIKKAPRE